MKYFCVLEEKLSRPSRNINQHSILNDHPVAAGCFETEHPNSRGATSRTPRTRIQWLHSLQRLRIFSVYFIPKIGFPLRFNWPVTHLLLDASATLQGLFISYSFLVKCVSKLSINTEIYGTGAETSTKETENGSPRHSTSSVFLWKLTFLYKRHKDLISCSKGLEKTHRDVTWLRKVLIFFVNYFN